MIFKLFNNKIQIADNLFFNILTTFYGVSSCYKSM